MAIVGKEHELKPYSEAPTIMNMSPLTLLIAG